MGTISVLSASTTGLILSYHGGTAPTAAAVLQATTVTTYDLDGNVTSITDADANKTSYSYDCFNRTVSQSGMIVESVGADAAPVSTTYQYDANGNLVEKVNALGQATVYGYDQLNRQTSETWYPSAADVVVPTDATEAFAFGYDLDGGMLRASESTVSGGTPTPVATDSYTYDSFGNKITDQQQIAGLTPTVTLTDQYDADGNRTSLSAQIGSAYDFVNGYSYDHLNREKQVTQAASTATGTDDPVDGKLVNFTYDADGEFATIDRRNSSSARVALSTYAYDSLGQVTGLSQTASDGSTTYADYTWTYDADSEVLGFVNAANVGGADCYAAEGISGFSYDSQGDLIGATPANGTSTVTNSLADTYDANGNATNIGPTTATAVAASAGAGNTQLADGTYSEQYDANGNLLARWVPQASGESSPQSGDTHVTTYGWDNRGRLIGVSYCQTCGQVSEGDWSVAYTYDMFNNLIGRTVTTYGTGGTTTTQHYVFDGTNMVLALGSGDVPTDRYLWGPAVDQVLADEQPGLAGALSGTSTGTLWALGDNQNSVRDVVEDDGTLEQHIAYSPFGQQVTVSTTVVPTVAAFAFGYTGTYTDTVTGLQLHGARWYDPASQRWLSQDPAAADSNLYRYCGNAPTDGTDPSGLAEAAQLAEITTTDPVFGPGMDLRLTFKARPEFVGTSPTMIQSVTETFTAADKNDKGYVPILHVEYHVYDAAKFTAERLARLTAKGLLPTWEDSIGNNSTYKKYVELAEKYKNKCIITQLEMTAKMEFTDKAEATPLKVTPGQEEVWQEYDPTVHVPNPWADEKVKNPELGGMVGSLIEGWVFDPSPPPGQLELSGYKNPGWKMRAVGKATTTTSEWRARVQVELD